TLFPYTTLFRSVPRGRREPGPSCHGARSARGRRSARVPHRGLCPGRGRRDRHGAARLPRERHLPCGRRRGHPGDLLRRGHRVLRSRRLAGPEGRGRREAARCPRHHGDARRLLRAQAGPHRRRRPQLTTPRPFRTTERETLTCACTSAPTTPASSSRTAWWRSCSRRGTRSPTTAPTSTTPWTTTRRSARTSARPWSRTPARSAS